MGQTWIRKLVVQGQLENWLDFVLGDCGHIPTSNHDIIGDLVCHAISGMREFSCSVARSSDLLSYDLKEVQ